MTFSPLKKFVLTPALLSTAVFAALTLPLAVLGTKPVTIQLQDEPVFHGQLRDAATPYLGLASVLSLGAGLASVAVTGWRQSTRKSSQVEAQLSELAQSLKAKEAQLEALKLSESQLETYGLNGFMDEEVSLEALKTSSSSQDTQPVVKSLVVTTQPLEPQPAVSPQMTVQVAARQFASAQTYMGYSQVNAAVKPEELATSPSPSEIKELQNQLQHIMAQMASVQKALLVPTNVVTSEAQATPEAQVTETATWKQLHVVH